MPRVASGRRQESYFPIAVADNKFHCIILKGGDQYPYFPRPLLSEFDFSVPLASAPAPKAAKKSSRPQRTSGEDDDDDMDVDEQDSANDDDDDDNAAASSETRKLEQQFLLHNIRAAQLADVVDDGAPRANASSRAALARVEVELDKTLLQLLAAECRAGEDRGMRALEMVRLMRDRTGRMLAAAGKVAERYGRGILGDKIREVGERRLMGGGEEEEEENDDDPFGD